LLKALVPFLPPMPALRLQLTAPSTDYEPLQAVVSQVRARLGLGEEAAVAYQDLIGEFGANGAVVAPVLWGQKQNHKNALHILLPQENVTFIFLNLDTHQEDFKFWMAHELGHVLTVDLLREGKDQEAEDFADAFAGALLFPAPLAEAALADYERAKTDQGRLKVLEKWAKEHTISPNSVYLEIEKRARETKGSFVTIESKTLFPAIAAFNKGYKTLSTELFDGTQPTADHFMRVAQESFGTEVYGVLGKYVREKEAGPGVIATILDVSPMDARAYLEALSN
jgi:Zn-dependent peptidase ImmA (M78 family)